MSWLRRKCCCTEAQARGQILNEEELSFLTDPDILEGQSTQIVITHNAAYQAEIGCNMTPDVMNFNSVPKFASHGDLSHLWFDALAESVEIDLLKQTLSEHLKEKESLLQTVTLLKNDFKKEESRNIDREIALEKQIKHLDNIVFKRDQSAQTVHITHTFLLDPPMLRFQKNFLKFSMVNTSLKKLKHHLANFDVDLFSTFNQHLVEESFLKVPKWSSIKWNRLQTTSKLESKTFEVKMNQVLNENERLLEQVMSKDIVNLIVNSSVDNDSVNVRECQKCLKLETELQTDFVEKETYDKLFKSFTILEKHCISLEVDTQLKQEIFQRENSVSNQSVPSFDQLFELNELKAQSQEKDTVIKKLKERIKSLSGKIDKDKIKQDLEEIETINIELDHRVTKAIAEE
ncbi:hypothetical protein Tco_0369152 [Tanacetum coccineum]